MVCNGLQQADRCRDSNHRGVGVHSKPGGGSSWAFNGTSEES